MVAAAGDLDTVATLAVEELARHVDASAPSEPWCLAVRRIKNAIIGRGDAKARYIGLGVVPLLCESLERGLGSRKRKRGSTCAGHSPATSPTTCPTSTSTLSSPMDEDDEVGSGDIDTDADTAHRGTGVNPAAGGLSKCGVVQLLPPSDRHTDLAVQAAAALGCLGTCEPAGIARSVCGPRTVTALAEAMRAADDRLATAAMRALRSIGSGPAGAVLDYAFLTATFPAPASAAASGTTSTAMANEQAPVVVSSPGRGEYLVSTCTHFLVRTMTSRSPGHPMRSIAAEILSLAVCSAGELGARLAVSASAIPAALELLGVAQSQRSRDGATPHGLELCAALGLVAAVFNADAGLAFGFGEPGSSVGRALATVLPQLLLGRGAVELDGAHWVRARVSTCACVAAVHAARLSRTGESGGNIGADNGSGPVVRGTRPAVFGISPERVLDVLVELLGSRSAVTGVPSSVAAEIPGTLRVLVASDESMQVRACGVGPSSRSATSPSQALGALANLLGAESGGAKGGAGKKTGKKNGDGKGPGAPGRGRRGDGDGDGDDDDEDCIGEILPVSRYASKQGMDHRIVAAAARAVSDLCAVREETRVEAHGHGILGAAVSLLSDPHQQVRIAAAALLRSLSRSVRLLRTAFGGASSEDDNSDLISSLMRIVCVAADGDSTAATGDPTAAEDECVVGLEVLCNLTAQVANLRGEMISAGVPKVLAGLVTQSRPDRVRVAAARALKGFSFEHMRHGADDTGAPSSAAVVVDAVGGPVGLRDLITDPSGSEQVRCFALGIVRNAVASDSALANTLADEKVLEIVSDLLKDAVVDPGTAGGPPGAPAILEQVLFIVGNAAASLGGAGDNLTQFVSSSVWRVVECLASRHERVVIAAVLALDAMAFHAFRRRGAPSRYAARTSSSSSSLPASSSSSVMDTSGLGEDGSEVNLLRRAMEDAGCHNALLGLQAHPSATVRFRAAAAEKVIDGTPDEASPARPPTGRFGPSSMDRSHSNPRVPGRMDGIAGGARIPNFRMMMENTRRRNIAAAALGRSRDISETNHGRRLLDMMQQAESAASRGRDGNSDSDDEFW